MKKGLLFLSLSLPLLLVSCGGTATSLSSSASVTSSGSAGNTLTSVFSSFGPNLTVNATFPFLNQGGTSTPALNTAYVDKGCYFRFTNFGTSYTSFGLVDVAENAKEGVAAGTYKWTDKSSALVLGDKVSDTVGYRSLYNTPSEIGANAANYVAAFIPEIAGTSNGYFTLNKSSSSSSSAPVDRSAELLALTKSLGVYNVIASLPALSLDYARLYFSETGSTFTFHIFAKYEGGFNGVDTTVVVSKVNKTTVADIDGYFAA